MIENPKPEKQQAYAEIMHLFRYYYKDAWAPPNIDKGRTRLWKQAFSDLVKQGFIERKKTYPGYSYRWVGAWPEGF